MDNKKIGKLIKDLRKQKGLTQQDLGDKVGVGFRSVSKWERGLTLPDITIINEVSKILGISSDELLSGKINKEHKDKKLPSKFKITFSIIITLTVILITSFIYYYNQTYTYSLFSESDEYYVDGKIVFEKDNTMIIINKLEFENEELYPIKIKNYEYQIISNNEIIIGYGSSPNLNLINNEKNIKEFINSFRINYNGKLNSTKKEIIKNKIIIKLEFTTEDNIIINNEIIVKLRPVKSNKK